MEEEVKDKKGKWRKYKCVNCGYNFSSVPEKMQNRHCTMCGKGQFLDVTEDYHQEPTGELRDSDTGEELLPGDYM